MEQTEGPGDRGPAWLLLDDRQPLWKWCAGFLHSVARRLILSAGLCCCGHGGKKFAKICSLVRRIWIRTAN